MFIIIAAGFVFGYMPLFSFGNFINAQVMDMVYTRQQKCK